MGVYVSDEHQHLSFTQEVGHVGSHPHLVYEFLDALEKERAPFPNAKQPANITCVGILAHESSKKRGEVIRLPEFTFSNPGNDPHLEEKDKNVLS